MPLPRKLPASEVLLRMRGEMGLNNRQIGERYGVSPEAVRQALERAGFQSEVSRPSHRDYIPWRIRGDHMSDVLVKRLRLYSKHRQGLDLSAAQRRQLTEWMAFMDGANPKAVPLSVHYDRNDDEGFWLAPRREGDHDYVSPPLESVSV